MAFDSLPNGKAGVQADTRTLYKTASFLFLVGLFLHSLDSPYQFIRNNLSSKAFAKNEKRNLRIVICIFYSISVIQFE
jgi:hypothetical protein